MKGSNNPFKFRIREGSKNIRTNLIGIGFTESFDFQKIRFDESLLSPLLQLLPHLLHVGLLRQVLCRQVSNLGTRNRRPFLGVLLARVAVIRLRGGGAASDVQRFEAQLGSKLVGLIDGHGRDEPRVII